MGRGRPRKSTVNLEGTNPRDEVKDEATAEREKALKAAHAERSERQLRQVVKSFYYERVGDKLIKRVIKGNGVKHSYYVGNVRKDKSLLDDPNIKPYLK